MGRYPGKMAWAYVCKPKKEDGLGLKSIKMWNIAAMSKYDWMIASKKRQIVGKMDTLYVSQR